MAKVLRRAIALCLLAAFLKAGFACAEGAPAFTGIPRIDSSTARIPITNAIYALMTDEYKLLGPEPVCSKTHGAWLNLADKRNDIVFTVAPTADEYQYFLDKGVQIEVKVYGSDGLVFIGNEANYARNLTSDQVRDIYSGKIRNWSAIEDGDDAPIDAYIRNPESGSQRLFELLVWAGHDMPDFRALGLKEGDIESIASEYQGTVYYDMEGIVEGVAANPYAIGFNIMSYVDEKFLMPSEEDAKEWVVHTTGDVNLRTGPGLSYKGVGTIAAEKQMPYLGETGTDARGVEWYKVRHDTLGAVWLSSRYGMLTPVVPPRVSLFSIDGFAPNTENFASGDYPFLTTSIVAIRKDEPEGSPARQLFDWIGSEESRALIAANSTLSVHFSAPYEYKG